MCQVDTTPAVALDANGAAQWNHTARFWVTSPLDVLCFQAPQPTPEITADARFRVFNDVHLSIIVINRSVFNVVHPN